MLNSMKSLCFSLLLVLTASVATFAQPKLYPPAVITYTFQQTSGTNGSAVTYNPAAGLYYATIAGNPTFPLEVFNSQGQTVAQTEARADLRGLWWNKKSKSLEGNCAGEIGWVKIGCGKDGLPSGSSEGLVSGQRQPDFQSVGDYDAKKKQVVFYMDGSLFFHNAKTGEQTGTLRLSLPVSKDNINFTTVGYTGQKNYEFALLDFEAGKLYYFNRKGAKTGESELPLNVAMNPAFRWSFANGIAFIYDANFRSWIGYKVF
jgi:hypothetical protein